MRSSIPILLSACLVLPGCGRQQEAVPGEARREETAVAKQTAQPAEQAVHPLKPAIEFAERVERHIAETITDYSAIMLKRERIDGRVGDCERLALKIRHKPCSVYLRFLEPASVEGREVIYVAGKNNGDLLGHSTGLQHMILGTLSLTPTGRIAMRGQHYPITEIGILNLVRRLIEVGKQDSRHAECEVKMLFNEELFGRKCTCVEVVHPVRREYFLFHIARIFVDTELNLPIRYEAYDWLADEKAEPQLIEQYTYLDLKLNNGFTDDDFDPQNSAYGFK